MPLIFLLLSVLLTTHACPSFTHAETKIIISGGSNFTLPGNSLPGIAAAISQGAGLLHLKAAMTADSKIVILDADTLTQATDVEAHYPERIQADGHHYPFDFSYEEIRTLSLRQAPQPNENAITQNHHAAFLKIPLLADALALITAMTGTDGKRSGIVLEITQNRRYRQQGYDISSEVLSVVAEQGFTDASDGFIATYDPEELERIHDEILPALGLSLKTLQLVATGDRPGTMQFDRGKWHPYNYDWMFTKFGIKSLSTFADAIGLPPANAINAEGQLLLADYFEDAHLLGLQLLAYPFDEFAIPLPAFAKSFTDLAAFCLFEAGFDGLLTGEAPAVNAYLVKRLEEIKKQRHNPKTPIERLLENARRNNQQG